MARRRGVARLSSTRVHRLGKTRPEAAAMQRRWLTMIAVTTGLVLLGDFGVRASVSSYQARPLDRQNLGVLPHATTSSTAWVTVPGLGFSDGPSITARSGLAATLSVTVHGAPVQYRIILEVVDKGFRQVSMTPQSVSFDPRTGTESFSYTFVRALGRGGYTVNFFWRSPTGAPVTMIGGTIVLQYASAT